MLDLSTPIPEDQIRALRINDQITLSGYIFAGRDAVLPKLVKLAEEGILSDLGIDLNGGVIFHTAVSPAGTGPTSSNKFEIENSMVPLSKFGIKLHLGKGALKRETVMEMARYNAVYAIIPPVTALLRDKTISQQMLLFPEEGMEALHLLKVDRVPAIIAVAHGESIY